MNFIFLLVVISSVVQVADDQEEKYTGGDIDVIKFNNLCQS